VNDNFEYIEDKYTQLLQNDNISSQDIEGEIDKDANMLLDNVVGNLLNNEENISETAPTQTTST
jgi:hypothetical protein